MHIRVNLPLQNEEEKPQLSQLYEHTLHWFQNLQKNRACSLERIFEYHSLSDRLFSCSRTIHFRFQSGLSNQMK